jgi:hypothetical protein
MEGEARVAAKPGQDFRVLVGIGGRSPAKGRRGLVEAFWTDEQYSIKTCWIVSGSNRGDL